MEKDINGETFNVFVSESALLNGYFGVYSVFPDQPNVQVYLAGGFKSIDDAIEKANSIIQNWRDNEDFPMPIPEDYIVEYRKREDFQLKESYPLLEKDNLIDSVTAHINQWFVKQNKKTLLKGLLSHGNLIFYGTFLVLWIYWKHSTFTVPDFELPLVGKSLSGIMLNRNLIATYYPIALFLLYSASFFKMLSRNVSYNKLRQKVLILVKEHSWTLVDFAKLTAASLNKSENSLFSSLIDWLHSNDPKSLTNLLKYVRKDTESDNGPESVAAASMDSELHDNLVRWSISDFDQRLHNLLYLDKETGFRPAYMCFDPIIYLMLNNRTIFRTYSYLKAHGYQTQGIDAPLDPYRVQRVIPSVFWLGAVFSVCLHGGTCLWSILIEHSSFGWTILGTLASVCALVLPQWWNYMGLIRKRGFPSTEPIGAYTVGSFAPNRLSLVGW